MRKGPPPASPNTDPLPKESVLILPENPAERTEVMVLFRIIGRHSWDRLQAWHRSCPGSTVEHVLYGIYVLHIPPGGSGEVAA
jgi:hypothetical protein